MAVDINSALTKVLLLPVLLLWAFGATVWLSSLSNTKTGCRQPLARNLRTVLEDQQAVQNATTNLSMPAEMTLAPERTLETKEAESDQILMNYWHQIDNPRHDRTVQNCTLVMQTYQREKILPRVLKHYCKISLLERIVVVWNDVETPVPKSFLSLARGCAAELVFVVSKENKLTNRYIPRKEIQTDCVCLMDDDRIIDSDDMQLGFDVWKTFHHRIVGFEERSFIRSPKGKYVYTNYERRRFFSIGGSRRGQSKKEQSHLPPGYSIEIKDGIKYLHVKNKTFILGKASQTSGAIIRKSQFTSNDTRERSEGYNIMLNSCFIHRAYLEMYFDPAIIPGHLLEYVNHQMNCEDILMSVVVTKFLKDIGRPQCGVLAVKSNWIENLEDEARDEGTVGLSAREDHYKARSECLEKFAKEYGYLPLHTSKIVMTQVFYHL